MIEDHDPGKIVSIDTLAIMDRFNFNMIRTYMAISRFPFNTAVEISEKTDTQLATVYRYVKVWKRLGMVIEAGWDELPRSGGGKRKRTWRRRYKEIAIKEGGIVHFT